MDHAASPVFDPEVWQTWPIPNHAVQTRRDDRPYRLNEFGDGWVTGFETALRMAHQFNETGEWPTPENPPSRGSEE
jgi:hypothetical protein